VNKREIIQMLTNPDAQLPYIPSAFFLHFDKDYHQGQAAIDKHLEYFRYTDMDFVKIQYELTFPNQPEIQKPEDWAKVPLYGADFFDDQWRIVGGLVKAVGKETLVLMTLYSPYMIAGQIAGREMVDKHILENPEQVNHGMEIITESLMTFVEGCLRQGIDGFYHSTQGGETHRFGGSTYFDKCIKPFDLTLMDKVNQECRFNILHVCDYHGDYDSLSTFIDYPGDIINTSLNIGNLSLTGKNISQIFNKPFMGGLDRHGTLLSGTPDKIQSAIEDVILSSPDNFILGADCTVPGETNWDNLKTAISFAHNYRK